MNPKFEVEFLEEAVEFLDKLDQKSRNKIIYNIDKASYVNDPKLFKKLNENIWVFRTKYGSKQFRILAFWVKRKKQMSLIIATNAFVKKSKKTPKGEIETADRLRVEYLKTS